MEKKCKLCLKKCLQLHSIVNSHLQVLYDILTENPIIADQKKLLLCQKCCSGLQECYELRKTCLSSERIYSQMSNSAVNSQKTSQESPPSNPELLITPIVEPRIEISVKVEREEYEPIAELCEVEMKENVDEDTSIVASVSVKVEREEYEPIAELCEVEMKENVDEGDPLSITAISASDPKTANEKIYADEEKNYIIDESKIETTGTLNIKSHDNIPCPCNREKCFKCDICQKCYSQRQKLTIHTRIHTGEKPYKCDVCNKGFHTATVLTVHQRVHTGEKPFQCYVCEKCFKTKSARDMHINVIHANQKPFKCDYCDKCFSMQAKLNYHRSVHTGDRQFKCGQCDQSFIKKYKLDSHVRTWHS